MALPSACVTEFEAAANKPVAAKLGFCLSFSSATTTAPAPSGPPLAWKDEACDGNGPLAFRLSCPGPCVAEPEPSLPPSLSVSLSLSLPLLLRYGDLSLVLLCLSSRSRPRRDDSCAGLLDRDRDRVRRRLLSLSLSPPCLSLLPSSFRLPASPTTFSLLSRLRRRRRSSSES